MEHDLLIVISKIHTVKDNISRKLHIIHGLIRLVDMLPGPSSGALPALFQFPIFLGHIDQGHIACVGLLRFIHELEDPLRPCHSHDDGIQLLADLVDGHAEALVESQKTGQPAQREAAHPVEGQDAAHDSADHVADIPKLGIDGAEEIGKCISTVRTYKKPVIELLKLLLALLLMAEDLDHLLAVHHFLNESVHRP